tara:strand:+ start:775 stop:1401 length:627 start_codon:yes stop_codon:yes gene_type:complete
MSHRNLEYLNKRRIIYRQSPLTDEPTERFEWGNYYATGTHQCYELFRSKAKITTYKSLKWHLLVLWYLNPQLDPDNFNDLAKIICDKIYGFITFNVTPQLRKNIVYDVSMYDLEVPPRNRARKIIFDEFCGLDKSAKMTIVGKMVGRHKIIIADDVYEAMLDLHDNNEKITWNKIALALKCSERTVIRNIDNELKKEKELLNQDNEKI